MPDDLPGGVVLEAPRRAKPPRHWADLTPAERLGVVTGAGLPAFRAKQVSAHYFGHWSADPAAWTDLSAAHRDAVRPYFPDLVTPLEDRRADGGATVKSLYRLHDGTLIEAVLMRYGLDETVLGETGPIRRDRAQASRAGQGIQGPVGVRSTLCVSSQAGCGMNCPFCATGQGGLQRNLSTAEIVEQVRQAGALLASGALPGGPGRLNNLVFMGMGEPLANYAAVLAALRVLTAPAPAGFGLSARGITVSTVGLVPKMRQLAQEGLPVTLAVSLHAPDDDLRDELVPLNRRYPVDQVLDAAWGYAEATKRRVSVEYILIRDVNDQADRADRLARLLQTRGDWGWFHVNLIPLNPTPGSRWTASRRKDEDQFRRRLEARGVPVTIRDTRGRDIDGACGQLAARHKSS
ncbi:MAG: 23S rRNA (adenine(2503)-C(2))-methyltransferase RlmN [Propionibacteriaceae bacterium]|jgi:23S rRNA (adenine2503-C2)-methyltransferase|nr:23S rRNA (adenine(2503)-C(2))-methyltransferase RlmN [Propionibacteriaceae bacterium]